MNKSDPQPTESASSAERRFESFLWNSRYLVLLAVVPSILGALALFVMGTADILAVLRATLNYYWLGGSQELYDATIPKIIKAIDIYLIAIVLLVFAAGVYRLFFSIIEPAENSKIRHPFNINSFDQLKDKIARVVVLAVVIEFFRAVVDIQFVTPLDAIYLALSILALAGGLYLMSKAQPDDHK